MITPRDALLFAALAGLLAACGPNTEFTLPNDFVALADEDIEWRDYDWKAVNTDGAVVVLRERDNDEEGSVDFWAKALARELVDGQGYELLDTTEVKTRNMTGRQLHFQVDQAGTPFRYNVAVFVIDDTIVTIETAASSESWEAQQAALNAIVESADYD